MIIYMNMEGISDTGPTDYRPYPRRQYHLLILITKAALSTQLYFKTLSVGPAGVQLTTSRMTARCSTNEPPVRSAVSKFLMVVSIYNKTSTLREGGREVKFCRHTGQGKYVLEYSHSPLFI